MYNFLYAVFSSLSFNRLFLSPQRKFSPSELLHRCSSRHLTGQTPAHQDAIISAKIHLPPAILFISHQLDWSRTSVEKRESSVLFSNV